MNVTEKDFKAFEKAVETLKIMSGTFDDFFNEEINEINGQFKSFQRRYLKAKEE